VIIAVEGLMCVGKSSAIRRCTAPDVEHIDEVLDASDIALVPPVRMPDRAHSSHEWFVRNDWAKSSRIRGSHKHVLLDRYFVSTMAYMHSASRGAGHVLEFEELWSRCFEPLAQPDLWIMVQEDPRSSFARAATLRPHLLAGEWATEASVARLCRAFESTFDWLTDRGIAQSLRRVTSDQLRQDPEYLIRCFDSEASA
jgi:hypothetical protein